MSVMQSWAAMGKGNASLPQSRTSPAARNAAVLCTILFSLGFPGKIATLIGGSKIDMAFQYLIFIMQIAFMLLSSGESFMDIKLIDLRKEYTPIYLFTATFFITSMLVTFAPTDQMISCLRFTNTALFALWIIERYNVEEILTFTYYAQAIIVLASLVFMVAFPSRSYAWVNGERSFVGIFTAKNVCGAEVSFGITMQIALLRINLNQKKPPSIFFIFILLCQLLILVLCNAVGSLFTAAIPIFYIMYGKRFKGWLKRLPIGPIYIFGSVGFLLFALHLMPLLEPLLESMGKDATLTGRIPMWRQHVENMLNSHTFTGYGFGMFWENKQAVAVFHDAFDNNSWAAGMTTGAHNVIIEMWLNDGLIGIAVYFLLIFCSFFRIKQMNETEYVFCIAVMLSLFINGLTERLFGPASYWTLFFFLSCGLALQRTDPIPAQQQSS